MRLGNTLPANLPAVMVVLVSVSADAQVWEVGNQCVGAATVQTGRQLGTAVAVGDFDGDGIMDLVVGAPDWDNGATANAGRMEVYRGRADRDQLSVLAWSNIAGSTANGRLGAALAAGDFDGDGRDELAVGVPGLLSYGAVGAGKVNVREYEGTAWTDMVQLYQNDWFNGELNTGEEGDWYGASLAVGDFNHDGYEDLVVGVPYEDLSLAADAGMIHVYLGGVDGLSVPADQSFAAGREGVAGTSGDFDLFGFALAAGDFDGDDYDDLAIGVPYREVPGYTNAGQVHVLRGYTGGLYTTGQQLISGSTYDVAANAALFGYSLAAANFDQNPLVCIAVGQICRDDLAIGVPGADVIYAGPSGPVSADQAGVVIVATGSSTGVSTSSYTTLSQEEGYGTPEDGDFFGLTLTAGSANRAQGLSQEYVDLVVGAPAEDYGGLTDNGFIHVFFGSSSGINGDPAQPEQAFNLRAGFNLGPASDGDRFGSVLALGDLDGDGWGDLVIGIPEKDYWGYSDTGAALVLYGGLFADGFGRGTSASWTTVVP